MRLAILPLLTLVFELSTSDKKYVGTTSDEELFTPQHHHLNENSHHGRHFVRNIEKDTPKHLKNKKNLKKKHHEDSLTACFHLASRGSECVGALETKAENVLEWKLEIPVFDYIPCVNFAKHLFDIIHNAKNMYGSSNVCKKVINTGAEIPADVLLCIGYFGMGPVAEIFNGNWINVVGPVAEMLAGGDIMNVVRPVAETISGGWVAVQASQFAMFTIPGKLAAWMGCRTDGKSYKHNSASQCFSPPTPKCNHLQTQTFGSVKGKLMFIVPVNIHQIKNIKIRAGHVIDGIGFELYRGSTEFFQTGYGNTNQYENFPFHDMKPDKIKVEWVREDDWYGSVITSLTFLNTISGAKYKYGGNWKFDESLLESETVNITCDLGFLGHTAQKGLSFSIFTGHPYK